MKLMNKKINLFKFIKYIFINVFLLLNILFLFGCSSDQKLDFKDSVNVFENRNTLTYVVESKKQNSELDVPINNLNILNSKAYNLTNSALNFPLEKQWEVDTKQSLDSSTPLLSEPIFILSKIYLINSNGSLLKIDSQSGKILWEKELFENLENSILGAPAISGKYNDQNDITIFLHTGNDELLSIDGSSGEVNWKKKYKLPFRGGITFFKDRLFLSDYEGNFFSINSNNGEIIWSVTLGTDYSSVYTNARPIVAKNKIIVPGTGGSFFVLSLKTGEVIWTENISSNSQLPKIFHLGDIVANPVYYEGILYLVSQSGFMSAFDIETKEKLWALPIGGLETPVLSGKTIFVNGNMGSFVAINRLTGNIIWKKKYESYANINSYFEEETLAIYKGPVLVDSKLLFSDHYGMIKVLDANSGTELENFSIGRLALAPIPVNKKVFFLRSDGKLLAYE